MDARRLIGAILVAAVLAGCAGGGTPRPATPASSPATAEPTDDLSSLAPDLSGTIEFGTKFDPDTLVMTKPTDRFKRTYKPISYVIHLSEPAGATRLTLTLTKRSSGGAETTIVSVPFDVANPEFDTFANSADLGLLVDRKAGTYVMRLIREGDVLAEGTFTLVK